MSSSEIGYSVAWCAGIFTVVYISMKLLQKRSPHNYPPSLPTVPFFGSLPFLPSSNKLHLEFVSRSEKLGKVFSVYLGARHAVILNGYDVIRKALMKVEFSSRSYTYVFNEICNPNVKGIIERRYDADFKKYHTLSLTILKSFGFGQSIMEARINLEVEDLISQFHSAGTDSMNPAECIHKSVLNVIYSIVMGTRFNTTSDPALGTLIDTIHGCMVELSKLFVVDMLPPLRFLPSYRRSIRNMMSLQKNLYDIIEKTLVGVLADKTTPSFASSFIEAEGPDYDKEQLLFTVRDLLLAGSDTSTSTLQWAIVTVANHPHIQERLHRDIDAVVPRDRLPSLDDKVKLPYVEAFICELMRRRTVTPVGASHETLSDTEAGGYFIPQGTMVFANLYGCHMDAEVWGDPESFRPERFLDANEQVILKDQLIAFSIGKRSCLGELLARHEIFLFVTGLLQNFNIFPPEGSDTVEFSEPVRLTYAPADYKVRLVSRPVV